MRRWREFELLIRQIIADCARFEYSGFPRSNIEKSQILDDLRG